jgi:DNA modification methylase
MKKTISEVMVERIARWPIERLIPYVRNTRTHSEAQVAEVASSIAEFGFVHPVLAAPDGVIIAGHCRVLAAAQLAMREIPVVVLEHLSETQRKALAIADNRLALNAGWDEEMLRRELAALEQEEFPVDLLGFDTQELDRLLAEPDVAAELPDEDPVPECPRLPVSRAGDLWICGAHRVLCGDPLEWPAVERLMGGESADLVFTEPLIEGWGAKSPHGTDPVEKVQQFLIALSSQYRRLVKPTASLYICHPAVWQREFQNALENTGFAIACQIVWVWQSFAPGGERYQQQHTPIFYAHVAGQMDAWYGDGRQSSVWTPAQPGECIERILINSSRPGDVVVDLCATAGAGLVACERLGRRTSTMSGDSRVVDAMVMRWQQSTGRSAVHEGDSQSFAEVLAHRQLAAA